MSLATRTHAGSLSSKWAIKHQNGAGSICYYETDAETRFKISGQEQTSNTAQEVLPRPTRETQMHGVCQGIQKGAGSESAQDADKAPRGAIIIMTFL